MIPGERVNSFHEGQVWESPQGAFYTVISVQNKQATLSLGFSGTGRVRRRSWDAVVNWVISFDPDHTDHFEGKEPWLISQTTLQQ